MNIAVSACLLGEPCRFDGKSKPCDAVIDLGKSHNLVPVCPEVAGGLPIPHAPCEIKSDSPSLRVIDCNGTDRTAAFVAGAQAVLETIQREKCELAILKAKSPSCGNGLIYDGTFTETLVPGYGVAACLIREAGIPVIDETQIKDTLEN